MLGLRLLSLAAIVATASVLVDGFSVPIFATRAVSPPKGLGTRAVTKKAAQKATPKKVAVTKATDQKKPFFGNKKVAAVRKAADKKAGKEKAAAALKAKKQNARKPLFGRKEAAAAPVAAKKPLFGKKEAPAAPAAAKKPFFGRKEAAAAPAAAAKKPLFGRKETATVVKKQPKPVKTTAGKVSPGGDRKSKSSVVGVGAAVAVAAFFALSSAGGGGVETAAAPPTPKPRAAVVVVEKAGAPKKKADPVAAPAPVETGASPEAATVADVLDGFDITEVPASVPTPEPGAAPVAEKKPVAPTTKTYSAVKPERIVYPAVGKAKVAPADILARKRARADAYTESLKAKTNAAKPPERTAAEFYERLRNN